MNADSLSKELEQAQQERQQTQTQESQKLLEKFKSDFQSSLLAESQSFKNYIAATERRLKILIRVALAVTAAAVLFSAVLILAAMWSARQIYITLPPVPQPMSQSPDPFTTLREQKLIPLGNPVTNKDRIFIELQKTN